MTSTRGVDWRTCPLCMESFPWRIDTAKEVKICWICRIIIAKKSAVALANAGHGTGFGAQGGKR